VTWRKYHFENLATFFVLVSPTEFVLRTYLESGVVLLGLSKKVGFVPPQKGKSLIK
jgi:hypothetical protein